MIGKFVLIIDIVFIAYVLHEILWSILEIFELETMRLEFRHLWSFMVVKSRPAGCRSKIAPYVIRVNEISFLEKSKKSPRPCHSLVMSMNDN